jgi:catecholate siderophore receptor
MLTQPIKDTPQTITVIPEEVIKLQGLTDLRDVLKNDPSVQIHANEDSAVGTNVYIRGFSARYDVYLDGVLDLGFYNRDPFFLEQVNVLTGPSGVMFGRGSTGGVIEEVSKKPGPDPFVRGSLSVSTDPGERLTADINMPIADGAAIRINGLAYNSDIAGRDEGHNQRVGFAPSLVVGQGTPTQFLLSFVHVQDWDQPDYGLPWIDIGAPGSNVSHPAAVPWSNFYGFKNDYLRSSADIVTATVTHDLTDEVALHNVLRYGTFQRNFRLTAPNVDDPVPVGTPLDTVLVDRVQRGGNSQETNLDDQFSANAKFDTFGFTHNLVVGGEVAHISSDPTVFKYSGVPAANLISPDLDTPFSGTAVPKSIVSVTANTLAGYLVDTVEVGPFEISGAARIDRFVASYLNSVALPLVAFSHTDVRPSFRGSIVYKVLPDVSLYTVYGTSFDPSAEGLSLSAATADLAPERSHTVEAGVKWSVSDRLLVSADLFRTIMINLRETSPIDPTVDVLAGDARSEGFELLAQGHVTDQWTVLAGYTYLQATVISSPDGDVGNRLQNTPRHSLKLWSAYDVTPDLTLGGGVDYQSSRVPGSFPDGNGFLQAVPGYATISAVARYKINDMFSLQLNVDNIADRRYYDGLDDDHVEAGNGRSAKMTLYFND